MEFTTCYCPHPQCSHYGRRGGTHLGGRGVDRGIPRLLCTKCKGTFSARQGTAYFGVHAEEPNYTIAMRAYKVSIGPQSTTMVTLSIEGRCRATTESRSCLGRPPRG